MNSKTYIIGVNGCDDTTTVEMVLEEKDFDIVNLLCQKVTAASKYCYMPTMNIREKENKHE